MNLSLEVFNPIKRGLQIAVISSLALNGAGCAAEAKQEVDNPSATIIAIDGVKPDQRTYHIIHDQSAPQIHNTASSAILCIRAKNKPHGLFPNRARERRIMQQCERIQPVKMLERPVEGKPMIEGISYVVQGPQQFVPLS